MMNVNKVARTITFAGLTLGIGLIAGCGGSSIGGQFAAEFVYVATGTGVAQYAVNTSGQLAPLTPAEVVTTPTTTNSVWVTATKDAKYAYTANQSTGDISQYSISGSGALVALTPPTVASGTGTCCVEATPDVKFVYALNRGDGQIKQFAVGTGGTLSVLSPATVAVASDGQNMVITPDGKYLYATSYSSGFISAYSIAANGQLTPLGVPTYPVTQAMGATISPDGLYLYCPCSTGAAQFSIGTDGALTALTPAIATGTGVGYTSFAVSPDNKYGYLGVFNGGFPGSPVDQYSIGTGGVLSALAPSSVAAGNAPISIIVEPTGQHVFVGNQNDHTISEFVVGTDGTLTVSSPASVTASGVLQMAVTYR